MANPVAPWWRVGSTIGSAAHRLVRTGCSPEVLRSAGQVPRYGMAVAGVIARTGLLGPYTPNQLVGMARSMRRYGLTPASVYTLGAAIRGGATAAIDDAGQASFTQMEERSSTVAAALADLGIGSTDRVGVLCRNHRAFLTAVVALGKLGADTVYLNTGFAAPQLAEVMRREAVSALILDQEFLPVADLVADRVPLVVAWVDDPESVGDRPTFDRILAASRRSAPPAPRRVGRQVILTSGTTGTPKGAQRAMSSDPTPLLSMLSRIPLRGGDVTLIAAPMFHSWGLAQAALGMALGSTLVLPRTFDPEDVLRRIEAHRVRVVVAVPVMAQRMADLPDDVRARYDWSSLEVVALSGSPLPGDLAVRFMDIFGEVLYNLYGSTEVGWASIADPKDLRAAPGTAGLVPIGTHVRLLDESDREVAPGQVGRIVVRSAVQFDGYTGGGSKAVVDGYMATGDVGHFDAAHRLFVDGRDDDMIVSGGENVYPGEIEDLLIEQPGVVEAAVIGVPDDEFGQRLEAFVVLRPDAAITPGDLQAAVRANLARYKVPRRVVVLDALPRNATGKILRRQLRSPGT